MSEVPQYVEVGESFMERDAVYRGTSLIRNHTPL